MNLFTKQKQSHRCRKQTYGYQWGKGWGGINWEIGIDIQTLLYIKEITNKDLLYSTGNSTQYSVMTFMGKETKKEWIYVYDSLCRTPETNIVNQLYANKKIFKKNEIIIKNDQEKIESLPATDTF